MNSLEAPAASAFHIPGSWTRHLDLATLFPCPAQPLEVELGCGKGRFLATRAQQYPCHNFLGIDRQLTRLRKVERKLLRASLTNVKLLRIENAYTITHLLPPQSVTACYVFFPDPWPKRRHHERRLFNESFRDALQRVLVPGGHIQVRTDHTEYGEAIARLFAASTAFHAMAPLPPAPGEVTEFEELFMSQGLPITRLAYRLA